MWREERLQKIRADLTSFGQISIDRIVTNLGVSRETIRRDLMEMERAGLLRRIRGGAVPVLHEQESFNMAFQAPFSVRHTQKRQEKQAIARKALSFLKNGMTLFMDAGSTMAIMAQTLASANGLRDITVITTSIDVACALVRPAIHEETGQLPLPARFRVIFPGGEFQQDPMQITGLTCVNDIHRYHADIALLAPWGVDVDKGASNYTLHSAEVAAAMVRNAAQRILVADHSRIGVPARFVFCPREAMDILITDAAARTLPIFAALSAGTTEIIVTER